METPKAHSPKNWQEDCGKPAYFRFLFLHKLIVVNWLYIARFIYMNLKCPSCHSVLIEDHGHHICPKNHGVFLTLQEFRHETSPKFVSFIYASWLKLKAPRTEHCPQCETRMLELHTIIPKEIKFSSCPECFGMWLIFQDEKDLLALFHGQEDSNISKSEILGNFVMEHDRVIRKYQALTALGKALSWKVRRYW
ncbi:MAG TPA: zf-TFIIB domain-containing protein [Bdellovibrio sp.]|uniref:zf-TFIIB domain-containing protein n=1 Tax=Bdellovibrio sp. TaxID=28201 RepID=UPI002F047E29